MPEIDYVVLAEYVRQDAGMIHIMGAGIDTFHVSQVPAAVQVGVAARISFGSTEVVGAEHRVDLVFQGPDGPLMEAGHQLVTPPKPPDVPEHWRTAVGLVWRLPLPLPRYGDYSLELIIDNDSDLAKSIDVRAVLPGTGQHL